MRTLLVSVLLLVAIIVLYEATIGGEEGADQSVRQRGARAQSEIGQLEP